MNGGFSLGTIISAGDMSSTVTSSTIDVGDFKAVSLQFRAASATHVGTVAVQGSNDNSNWNALTLTGTPTAASGSAFDHLVEMDNVGVRYLRAVYTAGSGAGSLYCYAYGKA